MSENIILSIKLKILKLSNIYGGILSLLIVGIYLFFSIAFPGTPKYFLAQVILLPIGVILTAVFSYLQLGHNKKIQGDAVCSLLPGFLISAFCIIPGLIIVPFLLNLFIYDGLNRNMSIIFIMGILGLVFGILSIYVLLKIDRTVPEGLEQWKVKGLQIATIILAAGVVVAGLSIVSGKTADSMMYYEIVLDASEDTTFYMPVPVNLIDNDAADITNELRVIEGDARWNIVDTEHGKALEVHTSSKCKLYVEKNYGSRNWDDADIWLEDFSISMLDGTDRSVKAFESTDVWVFASNENTSMILGLSLDDGFNDMWSYTIYETSLDEGWQTVNVELSKMKYD
ncbi:MAG: hypothetical protein C5S45_03060 [Candidatus Methanocomedens sp.]|nr:MAG: hypothetical protein C5S45_03060 [ANME-2 cluster archaeon]